jgi:hypothetical protein
MEMAVPALRRARRRDPYPFLGADRAIHAVLKALLNPERLDAARFGADIRETWKPGLRQMGGQHIILVRSQEGVGTPAVWLYNSPNAERSKII